MAFFHQRKRSTDHLSSPSICPEGVTEGGIGSPETASTQGARQRDLKAARYSSTLHAWGHDYLSLKPLDDGRLDSYNLKDTCAFALPVLSQLFWPSSSVADSTKDIICGLGAWNSSFY